VSDDTSTSSPGTSRPNATVADVGEFVNGFAFKPTDWGDSGRPIIRIQNLTDPAKPLNRTTRVVPEKYRVESGDLLVSWSATLDAFVWDREPALLNQHIFKVTLDERVVDRRFAYYLLKQAISEMVRSDSLHGSTMKHINRAPFLAHPICLPSIAHQRTVAAVIDRLFRLLDDGVAALERAKESLARYRMSVLQAAVTGELTAEWRAKNPPTEDGKALLARILRERRQKWEKDQLAGFKAKGKEPPKGWREKYEEPSPPDTSELLEVPDGWHGCVLGDLIRITRGVSYSKDDCFDSPHTSRIPILRANNIGASLCFDDLVYVSQSCVSDSQLLKRGDIVVAASSGSISVVGKAARLESEWRGSFGAFCMGIRVVDGIEPAFVHYFMQSAEYRNTVSSLARGSNINNLRRDHIESMPFRLAPPSEQRAIVEILDRHLGAIGSAAQRIATQLANAHTLRQSILKAALKGRLVPQDPNDEPASVLLERIKASMPSPQPKKTKRQKVKVK
jgi:type I restriction enzyme S subunit